jgi:hypothetical protein
MNYRVERGEMTPTGLMMRIVDESGRLLYTDEIDALARIPEPATTRRHVDFVVCDESQPRHGKPVLSPHSLQFTASTPLTFLDTELVIGTVDEVLICPPGTLHSEVQVEGCAAIATATLHHTVLAGVAWEALQSQMFSGVCIHGTGNTDTLPSYTARFISLGNIDGVCIEHARVLRTRETPITSH